MRHWVLILESVGQIEGRNGWSTCIAWLTGISLLYQMIKSAKNLEDLVDGGMPLGMILVVCTFLHYFRIRQISNQMSQ